MSLQEAEAALSTTCAEFRVVGQVYSKAPGCGLVTLNTRRQGLIRFKCRTADADGVEVGQVVEAVGEIRGDCDGKVILFAWAFDLVGAGT